MKNQKNDETATSLKEYFKDNITDIMKYLIELYEFQEGIKFVNTKIEKIGE